MPFVLTETPQFYSLEISLSNILMIVLFCSYIYYNHMEDGIHMKEGGGLKTYHMSSDYFVFKQKIYCSCLQIEGEEDHKIDHFLWPP